MLDKIINIRKVLELAVKLELAGSGSALLDFKEVHTEILGIESLNDDLQDYQISEGVNCG